MSRRIKWTRAEKHFSNPLPAAWLGWLWNGYESKQIVRINCYEKGKWEMEDGYLQGVTGYTFHSAPEAKKAVQKAIDDLPDNNLRTHPPNQKVIACRVIYAAKKKEPTL